MPHANIQPRAAAGFDPVRAALKELEASAPVARPRANISNACTPCKRRKRRCLGGQPCPACAPNNSVCHYEVAQDRRRKLFNEQTRAQTRFHRGLLADLLEGLRGDHYDVVLNTVRQSRSLEQIATQLDRLNDPDDREIDANPRRGPEQHVPPPHDAAAEASQTRSPNPSVRSASSPPA